MNGGYIMIYKNSKRIYLELFACLTLGKPILWYEDKNTCFFIDTISGGEISTEIVDDEEVRTYGDIILTKGGMTITITAENVVSEVGEIQPSSGSSVVANPTLSGDEESLSGLEVSGVKYAIPSGGNTLYQHDIICSGTNVENNHTYIAFTIINNDDTPLTTHGLVALALQKNGNISYGKMHSATGISFQGLDVNKRLIIGVSYNSSVSWAYYFNVFSDNSDTNVTRQVMSGSSFRLTDVITEL